MSAEATSFPGFSSALPYRERERERERDIDRRENLGTRLALKEPGVIEFILEIKLRVNK